MTIIPFDPSRRASASAGQAELPAAPLAKARLKGRPRSPAAALAAAEAKVATLERTLLKTLRENARNRLRAEKAEAALERLGIDPEQLPHPDRFR